MILFFALTIDAKRQSAGGRGDVDDDVHAALVEPLAGQGDGDVRLVLMVGGQYFDVEIAGGKFLDRLLGADDAGRAVHVAIRPGLVVHDPDLDDRPGLGAGAVGRGSRPLQRRRQAWCVVGSSFGQPLGACHTLSETAGTRERLVSLCGICVSAVMTDPVHVIGATGRSGLALCRGLLAEGIPVVPVVRNPEKWAAAGLPGGARRADLRDQKALRDALAGRNAGGLLRACATYASDPRRGARIGHAGPARQHTQIHPLAGCPRQWRAGGGGGSAGLRPIRGDAAPDDDLRRAGRRQRAASGQAAAAPAGDASARRRSFPRAADPSVRCDALHPRRSGAAVGTDQPAW